MMKRWVLCVSIVFAALSLRGQVESSSAADTVSVSADSTIIAMGQDSLINIQSPVDFEYIPAEENSAVLADRLSCIEKTIPLPYNEKVHAFINYFTIRDREYTRMVMRRSDLYFPLFEKYLTQYHLPTELKYLSIIESGLNPKAVSRARAVGLWQFMSGTGRFLGLRHDWFVDERMDPERSTEAACKYLTMLYSMFNDWPLALAAYNSGPGTVKKAIRRSGYKKSFWEVYPFLPRETRAYFPQFVAIMYAVHYSELHNFGEIARERLPEFDTLQVRQFFHFETYAGLTGTCVEDLQKLNPSIQRNAVPSGRPMTIKVPMSSKFILNQRRASILDSVARGRKEMEMLARTAKASTYGREMTAYTVRPGDGLGTIALRYHVQIDDIKQWNNLGSNLIHPGRVLNIWTLPPMKSTTITTPSPLPDSNLYIVQPGDTLWDISRKFEGLTIERLKILNNLKSNTVKPGQKLILG